MRVVDDLPLVPTTWIDSKRCCGCADARTPPPETVGVVGPVTVAGFAAVGMAGFAAVTVAGFDAVAGPLTAEHAPSPWATLSRETAWASRLVTWATVRPNWRA